MSVSLAIKPHMKECYVKYNNIRDPSDSGFDLFAQETVQLYPGSAYTFEFGVELLVSKGHFTIVPRSSIVKTRIRMEHHENIYCANPEESYILSVNIYVFGTEPVVMTKGERYFQLIQTDLTPFTMNLEFPYILYVKCSNPEILEMYKTKLISHTTEIYDIFPLLTTTILEPYTSTIVGTGVHVNLQTDSGDSKPLYLDIIHNSLITLANYRGIIDAGYRGELKVPIDYGIPADYTCLLSPKKLDGFDYAYIMAGDSRPFYVKFVDELTSSRRGEGGFGSTGRN